MSEAALIAAVLRRHGARPDLRLFRNSVGLGWFGKLIVVVKSPSNHFLLPGDVVLRGARKMTAGLAEGSADVIGIQRVGELGRFVSIELKTPNVRVQAHQKAWESMVLKFGGLAGVVRSLEDSDALLGEP